MSQRLHSTGLQKVLATITAQTLATRSKNMDFIVVALSTVEMCHFSQKFREKVAAVWNIKKAREQYQIFSGEFLVNLRQDVFTGRRRYLAGIWCTRDISPCACLYPLEMEDGSPEICSCNCLSPPMVCFVFFYFLTPEYIR